MWVVEVNESMLIILDHLDVQEIFRKHSLFYQSREETLIGQWDRRNQFIQDLNMLKKNGGGLWTKTLLRDSL